MVSPRSHFLFTPLLPAAVTGTVQLGSIVESVRSLLGRASLAALLCTSSACTPASCRDKHRLLSIS